VGRGILSAEYCVLVCNARLALGTNLLFYHLSAFAALSGSTCSEPSAKRGISRDTVETAFIVIQDASRGLIGTPPTALHLLKSATPRTTLARTRRWKSAAATPNSLFMHDKPSCMSIFLFSARAQDHVFEAVFCRHLFCLSPISLWQATLACESGLP
jgi:hypothetical protein